MKKHWFYIKDGEVKEATLDNGYTRDPHFWYDVDSDDDGGHYENALYETYIAASDAAIDYCNSMIMHYTNRRDTIIAKRIK